ncbi:RNA polymerase sigma-70 factor [Bacteroides reticulotermitis]|uniref:RNA polymerase ECF-type sigma factor n=2 Tax=Bacteroides reticulotermitis TaxID=1133319 RepID=W4UTU5_9BACE|nr:RNA polymerase sigma-70 factor [Bacteroides reticulotermitis]GAE84660.1 RNA polymerase ECF-type sigma factor [Bacteroides reticulotermitis JCM 10512]
MPQSSKHMDINDNHFVITALKASDEKVFEAVYRHYFRSLCGFCSQYVSEQEEIEEIVQDTLVWLWENRSSLVEELTLKTLLFTIVKNKALNRISHFEVRRRVYQIISEKYEREFSNPNFYLENELLQLYEEALAKLPKEFREAYEMNRTQRLTHKEIASKLNVSPQTINYRIGQALKLLRIALKDYLPLFVFCFGPTFLKQ